MPNRDLILLETVKTHRARLTSAFVFGELAERRVANDNLRRLIGGIVLAAVVCAGCVGFSLVSGLLGTQAAAQRQQAGMGPATGPIFAADTFDRRTTGGWGTAERGGAWMVAGSSTDYTVAHGAATIGLPEGQLRGGYLPSQLQDRSDVTASVVRSTGPQQGAVAVALAGRRVSSTQDYRANVVLGDDGSLAISLSRRADPTGPDRRQEESLSPTVILDGAGADPSQASQPVSVRLQVIGTSPTTLRAKAWPANATEPDAWTVTATDSTAGLQRPGSVGLSAVRSGGTGPAALSVTDLVARTAP